MSTATLTDLLGDLNIALADDEPDTNLDAGTGNPIQGTDIDACFDADLDDSLDDTHAELAAMDRFDESLTELDGVIANLTVVRESLELDREHGGMNRDGAMMFSRRLENCVAPARDHLMAGVDFPGLEEFEDVGSRLEATDLGLEGIGKTLQNAGRIVMDFLRRSMKFLKDIIKSKLAKGKKARAGIAKLREQIKDLEGTPAKEVNIPVSAQKLIALAGNTIDMSMVDATGKVLESYAKSNADIKALRDYIKVITAAKFDTQANGAAAAAALSKETENVLTATAKALGATNNIGRPDGLKVDESYKVMKASKTMAGAAQFIVAYPEKGSEKVGTATLFVPPNKKFKSKKLKGLNKAGITSALDAADKLLSFSDKADDVVGQLEKVQTDLLKAIKEMQKTLKTAKDLDAASRATIEQAIVSIRFVANLSRDPVRDGVIFSQQVAFSVLTLATASARSFKKES